MEYLQPIRPNSRALEGEDHKPEDKIIYEIVMQTEISDKRQITKKSAVEVR